MNLFDYANVELVDEHSSPVPRKRKQYKMVYKCNCGKRVTVYVNVVSILCGCGRSMREG